MAVHLATMFMLYCSVFIEFSTDITNQSVVEQGFFARQEGMDSDTYFEHSLPRWLDCSLGTGSKFGLTEKTDPAKRDLSNPCAYRIQI